MATITVDLDEFDDDEIAEEYEARSLGRIRDSMDELQEARRAVARGKFQDALSLMDRLLTANPTSDKRAAYEKALANRDLATGRPLIV